MQRISSIDNIRVREVRELVRKARVRRKMGCFVAEGERLIREIPPEDILRVFVTGEYGGAMPEGFQREGQDARCFQVSSSLMEAMSDTKTSQGILAVVRMREAPVRRGNLFLLLENIQDPGNLGTMFRTAEAAGVDGILMSRDCVDIYAPKLVRSTMGSLFRMPFWIYDDLGAAAEELRREGVALYGTVMPGGENCYRFDFRKPSAFLIGNEGKGLSGEMLSHADRRLTIPMRGKVSSLNAAMAASILCYEAFRQRSAEA